MPVHRGPAVLNIPLASQYAAEDQQSKSSQQLPRTSMLHLYGVGAPQTNTAPHDFRNHTLGRHIVTVPAVPSDPPAC